MVGKIEKYDSSSQTYTIQWDEDDVKEDFSDLNKVDNLVDNAEKNVSHAKEEKASDEDYFLTNSSREQQEENTDIKQAISDSQVDMDYSYNYNDLSSYQAYPIGTPALLEFADGWYEGKITDFSLSDDKKN